MVSVKCPYCGLANHTSCPEVMAECAYCGKAFAQVDTSYQRLTVLDRRLPDAAERAEELKAEWEMSGELERDAIVDRRLHDEEIGSLERRNYPYTLAAA